MKQVLKLDEVHAVESSNIAQLGYQGKDAYVVFTNGNVYKYPNTSRDVFDSLLKAESIGKMFSQTLRKYDDYEALEAVVVPNEDTGGGEVVEDETIEIIVKYKGKEFNAKRQFTKAFLNLNKDMTEIQVKEASNGAMQAMRNLLNSK
jgi:hypothetical protein